MKTKEKEQTSMKLAGVDQEQKSMKLKRANEYETCCIGGYQVIYKSLWSKMNTI